MPDQPELYKIRGTEADFNVYVTSEFGVKELEAKPPPPPPEITPYETISESVLVNAPIASPSETISESASVTVT